MLHPGLEEQDTQTPPVLSLSTTRCEPIPEAPKRAVGSCRTSLQIQPANPACKSAPWHSAGTPSPAQETCPHTPSFPWTLGTHRLHPFQNTAVGFHFNKGTGLTQAAAVRGHNSREICLPFQPELRGISNVTQSLSPLALHLLIYGLGQQWPEKFIKK